MPRKSLVSDERKRRIKEVAEKLKADERTADEALDEKVKRSIEKHGA